MNNLAQIPESEFIIVKYKEGMTEVIEAGEIASCIAYNEGYNLEFFTAVKDAVQINERELITTLTEMLGDDQYEDWAEDMFYELIEEKKQRHLWKHSTKQRKIERVIAWVKRLSWKIRRGCYERDFV